jgi:hypothetical protein
MVRGYQIVYLLSLSTDSVNLLSFPTFHLHLLTTFLSTISRCLDQLPHPPLSIHEKLLKPSKI